MNSEEYEAYEIAVNNAWLKLGGANTSEEIEEVLNTWPVKEDFCKDDDDKDSDNNEQPTVDK